MRPGTRPAAALSCRSTLRAGCTTTSGSSWARVYKSWAVTRGPSFDPKDKRLAVHVEDHPLDYGTFEGAIPKGEYGGGTVMVWDTGTWEPEGDAESGLCRGPAEVPASPGSKLRGAWMLVRMKGRQEKQDPWLLIKERDEFAKPGDASLPEDDVSVQSGRSMAEIAEGAASKELDTMPGVRAAPARHARLRAARREDWLFEIKHDGYRCQLRIEHGRCVVRTQRVA